MHASSHKLAPALADRLGDVLPSGLSVRASGGGIEIVAPGGVLIGGSNAAALVDDAEGETSRDEVETAARAILSAIQDDVMEYLTLQWPVGDGGEVGVPNARADADRLHLWFGTSETSPVVRLRPISFSEITDLGTTDKI